MDKFRFSIMGAGKISNKFCDAARRIENCEVTAVSSKSLQKAVDFMKNNNLKSAYGNYKEMLEKEKPDCVYIGVLPNNHYELTMLCLDYNVPVLCEKAMFIDSRQAEKVFERSLKQNVFVMEALWSRFLPAVNKVKHWVEEGRIGKPRYCRTMIGFLAPEGEQNRYHNADLGGGAAHDILVYAYELTTYILSDSIEEITVSAIWENTGVDITDHVMLRYVDAVASLITTFTAPIEEEMVIYGENGRIVLPKPHCAKEAFLYGRNMEPIEHYKDEKTENGFVYEIKETMDCIRGGKVQSLVVPQKSTLDCSRLFDLIEETKK